MSGEPALPGPLAARATPGFRGRTLALALLALVAALGVRHGPALVARLRRERALRATIEALGKSDEFRALREQRDWDLSPDEEPARALVGFDDPEAVLALLRSFAAAPPSGNFDRRVQVVEAVELFATEPEPRDARVRDVLETLERAGSDDRKRLLGSYLLEELEHPTHAREPEGFSAPGARVDWAFPDWAHALDTLVALGVALDPAVVTRAGFRDIAGIDMRSHGVSVPRIEDTPWRALVRLARALEARVEVEGARVRLVSAPRIREWGAGSWRCRAELSTYLHVGDGERHLSTVWAEPPFVLREDSVERIHGAEGRVEPAIRAVARAAGLAVLPAGERRFVAFAPDRKAHLARLLAAVPAARTDEAAGNDAANPIGALLAFDEPEAFAAILERFAAGDPSPAAALPLVLEAGQLFAATSEPDARIRELVARLAASDVPPVRFAGLFLEAELREPSLPRTPPALARAPRVALAPGSDSDAIAAIQSATGVRVVQRGEPATGGLRLAQVSSAWRAVLRLAIEADSLGAPFDVRFEETTIVLERPPRDRCAEAWDDPARVHGLGEGARGVLAQREAMAVVKDKRRGLEALAKMQGCVLRELPSGELAFVPAGEGR